MASGYLLTTGVQHIDYLLGGGIQTKWITEIVGESGSGKTQFCYQLMLTCQLPLHSGGLLGQSVYMHTKFVFATKRVCQIQEAMIQKDPLARNFLSLENIKVLQVNDLDQLWRALAQTQELCTRTAGNNINVRLVILDSITQLFRATFSHTSHGMIMRNKALTYVGSKLLHIATKFNVAVLVTNEVTDFFGSTMNPTYNNIAPMLTSGRFVIPALGRTWTSCINSRLFLQLTYIEDKCLRCFHVIFKPYPSTCTFCMFNITSSGIVAQPV